MSSNSADVCAEVRKLNECPICISLLTTPIYQCHNGHLLCASCENRIINCPTCRVPLSKTQKIRSRALETIVGALDYDCENVNLGCPVKVKVHDLDEHTVDCPYRLMTLCKTLGLSCSIMTNFITCKEHIKTHQLRGMDLMGLPWVKVRQHVSADEFGGSRRIKWKPVFFLYKGELFFLRTRMNGGLIMWTVLLAGSKRVADSHKVKLEVLVEDHTWSWTGKVFPISEARSETFAIPSSTLKSHSSKLNSGQLLHAWTVHISFKPNSILSLSGNEQFWDLENPAETSVVEARPLQRTSDQQMASTSFAHNRIPSTFYPNPYNLQIQRL